MLDEIQIISVVTVVTLVPAGPPTNLSAEPMNSTSLRVTWDEPTADDQNGIITSYIITYQSLSAGDGIGTSNTPDTEIILSGLEEFTVYNIIVNASTAVGTGPGVSIMARTQEDSMSTDNIDSSFRSSPLLFISHKA